VSRDFRNAALRDPRAWETLIIDKDLATRLWRLDNADAAYNCLRQIFGYAVNGVKTLELHGAKHWGLAGILMNVGSLTSSPVFFENLKSLVLDHINIEAEGLVDFLEKHVLIRPKQKRLEKLFITNTLANFDGVGNAAINRTQLARLTESLCYDANDVFPTHFNIVPCDACDGICQFDQDRFACDLPWVSPACGGFMCELYNDESVLLCNKFNDLSNPKQCEKCWSSRLCGREGCPSYHEDDNPSKYIDDRSASCECGNVYALEHAPELWLKGLDPCAELGCGRTLCSESLGCRMDDNGDPLAMACSICGKVWCEDHIPPGARSCKHAFLVIDFIACPSCFQTHKETGERFKLCKCSAKIACDWCAKGILKNCSELCCRRCKPARSKNDIVRNGIFDTFCGSDSE